MTIGSRVPLRSAASLALVVLHACHDASPPLPASGVFAVTVELGEAPRYRWDAAPAYSVRVAPVDAPISLVWGITDTLARLASPLDHGTHPLGAVAMVTSSPGLQPGTRYRVTVTLADGRTGMTQFRTAPTTR